jgi:hypothetical protein
MNAKFSALCLVVAAFAGLTTACSGANEGDENASEGALVAPEGKPIAPPQPLVDSGKFRLSANPPSGPAPAPAFFETLEIGGQGTTGIAVLRSECLVCAGTEGEPVVAGVPGGIIDPISSSHQYSNLTVTLGSCGTKIYSGTNGNDSVKITDYRQATCVDVASDIFVEETIGGARKERYGVEQFTAPASCPVGSSLQFCWGSMACVPNGAKC